MDLYSIYYVGVVTRGAVRVLGSQSGASMAWGAVLGAQSVFWGSGPVTGRPWHGAQSVRGTTWIADGTEDEKKNTAHTEFLSLLCVPPLSWYGKNAQCVSVGLCVSECLCVSQ